MEKTVKVYVQLLDEGTPTARGTQAIEMGEGLYKLLPTADYDSEDEVWEFLPGSIVRCEERRGQIIDRMLLAVEQAR
ncbi:MAG: hypothetical protein H6908_06485 [Hyphomicrobiales bacterium]|nr:hypothetical protein [Hyphomicrobiales bacterium]